MKLYYSPGACSLSPHIVLREAGLAFEPVLASTKTHKLQDGTDYYGINPKGYVPLLELDNGERMSEASVLVQYLADQAPADIAVPALDEFYQSKQHPGLYLIGEAAGKPLIKNGVNLGRAVIESEGLRPLFVSPAALRNVTLTAKPAALSARTLSSRCGNGVSGRQPRSMTSAPSRFSSCARATAARCAGSAGHCSCSRCASSASRAAGKVASAGALAT